MTAAGLRDMLFSQAGLPPEVAADIDLASPSGAAVVALDDKGATGAVLAVPARGPAEAEKLIDALGKRVMTRGPVTLVENGTKSHGWVFRAGNVVVLSDEIEALTRGAMLALEARHSRRVAGSRWEMAISTRRPRRCWGSSAMPTGSRSVFRSIRAGA